jgi:peptidoglycan hydrolase-like protein with peptidoglycan-binding domain
MIISGTCTIGDGDVTITGTGFTPATSTTPCSVTGTYTTTTLTNTTNPTVVATQTDLSGNVGSDTASYILPVIAPPTVSILSPLGTATTGPTTITGMCSEIGQPVTITGTGFTPSSGTVTCIAGTYSFPITITGNTLVTASQTNGAGIAIANASTTLPSTSSGGSSSGGCLPGYPCDVTTTSTHQQQIQPPLIEQTSTSCPQFTEYLKQGMRDGKNGISEVSKVQKFLNTKLGGGLLIDGIFGMRTKHAVKRFQSSYTAEILSPWALSTPTGWWYQSTRSYANYLENCSEGIVQLDNMVKIKDGNVLN